jgi:hypothetical protein
LRSVADGTSGDTSVTGTVELTEEAAKPGMAQARSLSTSSSGNTVKSAAQAPAKSTAPVSTKPQPPSATFGRAIIVAPSTVPGGCQTPDPYAKNGGIGICVNGEWLALLKGKPKRGGSF